MLYEQVAMQEQKRQQQVPGTNTLQEKIFKIS